jgi:hypothetical protein
MPKRSRHHHYVPKALQRCFSENKKNLWYSFIGEDGIYSDPELRNIDSTFKVFDFYTVLDEHDRPSDKIEKDFYSAIDDYLGALLSEVHNTFSKGNVPIFEGEELTSLHHLMLNLASRTPYSADGRTFDDIEIGRSFVARLIEVYQERTPAHPELVRFKKILSNERELNLHGKNIRVRGQALPKNDAIDALKDFVVKWAISEGRPSFVLQSAIIYRIGNGGSNGLSSPQCEWWMPISPKRAIILVRDPSNRLPLVYKISRDHMREINESSVDDRKDIASQSRDLLLSLTGQRRRKQA